MSRNAKRGLVGAGLVLALGYMIYLTTSGTGVSCEVCVEFRGATECRKATGKDREESEQAAASTACGLLSGGVTDGIACKYNAEKRDLPGPLGPKMSDLPPDKPKRRHRYAGTNPRHFSEKYKEHSPVRYGEDVAKVLARGQTPAGTHRPVMVREILEVLAPQPGELAVDCTLGFGGHATFLLTRLQPGGRLIGLDVDPLELPKTDARLRALGFGPETLSVLQMNYAGLAKALATPADVILADLGTSSMQIDNPARGFTYKYEGPLDLRMNPDRGQPASAMLARLDEEKLAKLLLENADEPDSAAIAHAIHQTTLTTTITTTVQLATIVRQTGATDDSVRRVFQALRIAVNDEFSALDAFLRNLPICLKPGGRAAVLTFHSGEDRRVKKAFQSGEREGTYAAIAQEVLRPAPEEIRDNPRSSSAKLRWARRA